MNNYKNIAMQAAAVMIVLGSLWFCVGEVGLGESWTAISNPEDVNATTNTTYGGDVDFVDRVITGGMFLSVLGPMGLGVATVNRKNVPAVNSILKGAPLLLGLLAITEFSDAVSDFLTGDFDFSANTDAFNAKIMTATGWAIAAVASLMGLQNDDY